MARINLPAQVDAVFREFRTCEFTTLSRDGTPVTWPTVARYEPDHNRFLITTSIAFPMKVYHIRRNPRVALLFSNPTGSGLTNPPAVLVQGDATAPDQIVTTEGLEEYYVENIFRRQPGSAFPDNAIVHKLIDWYYMRIPILIKPHTIHWWPDGDFTQTACLVEVDDVE